MNNLFPSVQILQKRLREAGISSIVIGGIAVAAWGEPRLTRDVDLKISLNRQEAGKLLEILSSEYHSLISDPLAALQKQAMLFIQDSEGTRLDLLLADTPYDAIAIQRGSDVEMQPGKIIRLCSPEDLIIYKLISNRLRDHDDCRSVILRQGDSLDDRYVIGWLRQFETAFDDSTLVAEYLKMRQANLPTHKRR
jgi:hypothetical protein